MFKALFNDITRECVCLKYFFNNFNLSATTFTNQTENTFLLIKRDLNAVAFEVVHLVVFDILGIVDGAKSFWFCVD